MKSISKSTPEEKRVAIATRLGWEAIEEWGGGLYGLHGVDHFYNDGKGNRILRTSSKHRIPDYLNDLNACAEMVSGLTEQKLSAYGRNLLLIVFGSNIREKGYELSFIGYAKLSNATAAQRCDAFLLTIGWEE